MKNIQKLNFLLVILLVWWGLGIACQTSGNSKSQNNPKDTIKPVSGDTIKIVGLHNEVARYIGGLTNSEDSPFYSYTKIRHYRHYASELDSIWKKFDLKTMAKVKNWANTEIPDINKDYKTIFYPFSGPDYLFASNMFPKATKYIMFGLESVGVPPQPKDMYGDSNKVFAAVDTAIFSIINESFFRTRNMARDLNNKYIQGTLPILLLFISRGNNTIINMKPVELNGKGEIAYLEDFKVYQGNNIVNKGVEIHLKDKTNNLYKTVYYFSADISDGGLAVNRNCKLFLQKLDTTMVTYIKSASFLLHLPGFSFMRDLILKKSKTILQDDSGFPLVYLDRKKWDISLYGTYTQPYYIFRGWTDYDLVKAYKTTKSKPLDFWIGYLEKSNMQLITRK